MKCVASMADARQRCLKEVEIFLIVRNIVVFFKIRDKIIICIMDHLNITV